MPSRNRAFVEGCIVLFGEDWPRTAEKVLGFRFDRIEAWRSGSEIVPMAALMDVAHLLGKQWDESEAARTALRLIGDQF